LIYFGKLTESLFSNSKPTTDEIDQDGMEHRLSHLNRCVAAV